jgi:hypothetical protein
VRSEPHNLNSKTQHDQHSTPTTNTQHIRRNGSQSNQGYETASQSRRSDQQFSRPLHLAKSSATAMLDRNSPVDSLPLC